MEWLLAHLCGDYIFQTDRMAAGKKRDSFICALHVMSYLVPFFVFLSLSWWQLLAIGAQHFAQDRTNFVVWFMRKKGSAAFAEPPMAPWSIIVTDNVLHLLWIAWIIKIGSPLNDL